MSEAKGAPATPRNSKEGSEFVGRSVSKLRSTDFDKAGEGLGVEGAVVHAVADVEAPRGGFFSDGRIAILFEPAHFHRYTDGAYDDRPAISLPSIPKGYKYGTNAQQYTKLIEAISLDREAALRSTSWGRFQILGDHYDHLGFSSVETYVTEQLNGEQAQLSTFVRFVKSNPALHRAFTKKDWAGIARIYNGKQYLRYHYDTKLKEAYGRYGKQPKPMATSPAKPPNHRSTVLTMFHAEVAACLPGRYGRLA